MGGAVLIDQIKPASWLGEHVFFRCVDQIAPTEDRTEMIGRYVADMIKGQPTEDNVFALVAAQIICATAARKHISMRQCYRFGQTRTA